MKRIFAQKGLCIFLNVISLLVGVFSICGGFMIDSTLFYLLFASLFFSLLSLLTLINRIYYNEVDVEFRFIARKLTVKLEDIKEIYVRNDLILGTQVVFNFDRSLGHHYNSYAEYNRVCTSLGITQTVAIIGITRRDLKKFLKKYNGTIN